MIKMVVSKEVFFLVVLLKVGVILSRIIPPSDLKPKLIVKTTSGYIQGQHDGYTHGKNKTIYRFRGIPYAEPPVGNRRFEVTYPVLIVTIITDCINMIFFIILDTILCSPYILPFLSKHFRLS